MIKKKASFLMFLVILCVFGILLFWVYDTTGSELYRVAGLALYAVAAIGAVSSIMISGDSQSVRVVTILACVLLFVFFMSTLIKILGIDLSPIAERIYGTNLP